MHAIRSPHLRRPIIYSTASLRVDDLLAETACLKIETVHIQLAESHVIGARVVDWSQLSRNGSRVGFRRID